MDNIDFDVGGSYAASDAAAAVAVAAGVPRILVVEDEYLLAIGLEDDLEELGCAVVGPFMDLESATAASRDEHFDLAILDVNLNGDMVYPLADELIERGETVLLLTGYSAADLPERFRSLPRIGKPHDLTKLGREVRRLLPEREG